ncbi:MAG: outer membrane protein assembly factor BamA [Candidatus Krumholzibacteriota bacterium]|nr:outer membrane protein assembly factor BamA [Candidatus Krumholzibacteriota bacterium]
MRILVLSVVILCVISTGAAAINIGRVDVEGNVFVSEKKIVSVFGLLTGEEFRVERISEGIKRLVSTKDFANVTAYYSEENSLAVITVSVEEYPRVKAILFEGNDNIKDKDITEKIMLREGFFARPAVIADDIAAIRELLAEKGYNRAKITSRISDKTEDHRVYITYVIEEGHKVKIRNIDFIGNGAIESKEFRKAIESRVDHWWKGGEYKSAVLEEDLKKIETLYRNKGYLDARASLYRLDEINEGEHVDVYIAIDEGREYITGDIGWSGNEIVTDEEISDLVILDKGDPFSLEEVEFVQMSINSLYWEKGYIWSRVIPRQNVRKNRVDLDLDIIENNPASIKEIKIGGNTKTFETVIRRELDVYPGDRFILGEVQRSVREIFQMGYFEGPPKIDTEPVNDEGDINLLIDVQEKQTGNFKGGFGFSQLNKLSGFLGVQENNFLGRGKTIALDWEFGRYRKNMNLRYSEPHLFDSEWAMTVTVFNWIQDRVSQQYYTDRRKGFSVQAGHPFPYLDYTRAYLQYRFETVELNNFDPSYPEFGSLRKVDWPLNKSTVMLSLSRNSTDSPFHPTTGSQSSLSVELAGGPFGGNVKFIRYNGEMSWFRNLFWKFTFHLEMNAGLIDSYGGSEVEDYEKFRLGGNRRYPLRGYDFYEVVPEGNDRYIGGRFMTKFTQEIVFPFSQAVYGLVFFDAGNTWNSFRDANLFSMKRGLGLGIRLEMPGMGNLGFDYGYGYDKEGGAAWEPHFTFGTFF